MVKTKHKDILLSYDYRALFPLISGEVLFLFVFVLLRGHDDFFLFLRGICASFSYTLLLLILIPLVLYADIASLLMKNDYRRAIGAKRRISVYFFGTGIVLLLLTWLSAALFPAYDTAQDATVKNGLHWVAVLSVVYALIGAEYTWYYALGKVKPVIFAAGVNTAVSLILFTILTIIFSPNIVTVMKFFVLSRIVGVLFEGLIFLRTGEVFYKPLLDKAIKQPDGQNLSADRTGRNFKRVCAGFIFVAGFFTAGTVFCLQSADGLDINCFLLGIMFSFVPVAATSLFLKTGFHSGENIATSLFIDGYFGTVLFISLPIAVFLTGLNNELAFFLTGNGTFGTWIICGSLLGIAVSLFAFTLLFINKTAMIRHAFLYLIIGPLIGCLCAIWLGKVFGPMNIFGFWGLSLFIDLFLFFAEIYNRLAYSLIPFFGKLIFYGVCALSANGLHGLTVLVCLKGDYDAANLNGFFYPFLIFCECLLYVFYVKAAGKLIKDVF